MAKVKWRDVKCPPHGGAATRSLPDDPRPLHPIRVPLDPIGRNPRLVGSVSVVSVPRRHDRATADCVATPAAPDALARAEPAVCTFAGCALSPDGSHFGRKAVRH